MTAAGEDAEPEESVAQQRSGGLGRVVEAGLHGEAVTAKGLLEAIGGWRGVIETLLPAFVYLVCYIITRDARLSAIAPLVFAVVMLAWRLVKREPLQSAVSGFLGVAVCVAVTLFTGKGEDFYLPGFYINAAWVAAHLISLLVGWPLIGLLLGFLRGSLTEWRRVPVLRRASNVCTLFWIAVFAARLAVQLPLYFAAGNDPAAADALGLARLLMGIPLFALAGILTWLVLSRVSASIDAKSEGSPDSTASGVKAPSPSSDD